MNKYMLILILTMAGVIPNNYVNTEMVDNYCFDSCELKYNYQPIGIPSNFASTGDNGVYQIKISNPDNYKCKFSNEKYKLTDIYIILNDKYLRHSYERYSTGIIKGEIILNHKSDNGASFLNICIAIKGSDDNTFDTPLNDIFESSNDSLLNINELIVAKAYNYYDSNVSGNTGGDKNTHWIVFDANQASQIIESSFTTSDGSELQTISLPNAPTTISSIQYHEKGPQYIETSRIANCSRIVSNLGESIDNTTSGKNNFLENGLFGQKDPMIVSLLIFIMFVVFIGLTMLIVYGIKNFKKITDKISNFRNSNNSS